MKSLGGLTPSRSPFLNYSFPSSCLGTHRAEAPASSGQQTRREPRMQYVPEPKLRIENSAIKIHRKLIRVRAAVDGVDFIIAFVPDPAFDDVRSKDVASQKEVVVGFEGV